MQCWSKKINPSQELDVFQGSFRSVWSCSWWTEKKSTDVMWNVQLSCSLKTCNSLIVSQPYFNVSTNYKCWPEQTRTWGFFDVYWLGRKMRKRLCAWNKVDLMIDILDITPLTSCWTVVFARTARKGKIFVELHGFSYWLSGMDTSVTSLPSWSAH